MTGPSVAAGRELGRVEFGPDDLRRVREIVRTIAVERIPDRADHAVLAVHEVAVNSIVHGGGHGVLCIDETPDSLVFTVEDDDGTGSVPQLGTPMRRRRAAAGSGSPNASATGSPSRPAPRVRAFRSTSASRPERREDQPGSEGWTSAEVTLPFDASAGSVTTSMTSSRCISRTSRSVTSPQTSCRRAWAAPARW